MKNEKGITLIALIITIIVMLILVGVTINVAIQGGLFGIAKSAAGQTEIEREKEVLQSVALGYLNNEGKVDIDAFVAAYNGKTIEGYTITKDESYAVATKGEATLYIDTYGGVSDQKTDGVYSFKIGDYLDISTEVTDSAYTKEGISAYEVTEDEFKSLIGVQNLNTLLISDINGISERRLFL